MLRARLAAALLVLLPVAHAQNAVTITLPENAASSPLEGRLLLLISPNSDTEPRFQVRAGPRAIQVFGQDVTGWAPGSRQLADPHADGYPLSAWSNVEAGTYTVQAVLNRYETFELATGHTVSLPPDQGEGQQWNRKPGNLYSTPRTLRLDPSQPGPLELVLDQEIPPITPPEDTEYIKHITIQSDLLTEFWGRPMELGAHVLLPHGFEEHPEASYPLMIFHGHFPDDFGGFSPTPPDPTEPCVPSERFGELCYNRIVQQEAHDFYQTWTSDDFPRFIAIEIQHPTPYYDDSYAVNSASQGPYGDAIMTELVPYLEERFRGLGEGWARFTYGGSTGGWEALAVQVFYPDDFNGAFAACPDPIDFRAYELMNLYEDANAYVTPGPFRQLERPARRDSMGTVFYTVRDENHMERALGSKGRSGGQWDIWQATYSPMGPDGYPQPIFDKHTGEIDPEVASYWRENYDLRHILQRDWATLGPKLEGKIHIYVGDMDNYYLNNAVYLVEDFLESTTAPAYNGEVAYGDRDEHCWNGDPALPNAISRLRYNTMYVPRILERIRESAPAGADTTSWRY